MAVRASDKVTLAVLASPTYVRLYYVLQGSALAAPALPTANPPAAPWVTTEPTYTEGTTTTLYTVMLTAYGSLTFEYGAVQKSASFEAAKQAYNLAFNAKTVSDALDALTSGWQVPGSATTIDGANIKADTIIAAQIGALAITAKHTITGAVVQTATSGQRVVLNSTGLKAYDVLSNLKTTVGTDGILRAVSAVISGIIKSADSGQRVELDSTSAKFYSGISANKTEIKSIDNGSSGTAMLMSAGLETLMVGQYNLPFSGAVGVQAPTMYVGDLYYDRLFDAATNSPQGRAKPMVKFSNLGGTTSNTSSSELKFANMLNPTPVFNKGFGAMSAGAITIPETGIYAVQAGVNYNTAGAVSRLFIRLNRNSTDGATNIVAVNVNNTLNAVQLTDTIPLNAGDVIRMFVMHESGVVRTITAEVSTYVNLIKID